MEELLRGALYEIGLGLIASGGAVVGAGVMLLGAAVVARRESRAPRGDATPDPTLTPAEIWRPKAEDDRWILVTGAPASGKTTLVNRMVDAALSPPDFQQGSSQRLPWAGAPRIGEDDDVRVTELPLLADGRRQNVRLWERSWGESEQPGPAARDLDAIVLTIDPTCVKQTASTFPDALKAGPESVDVNQEVLTLDGALEQASRRDAATCHVIIKADLIRFSVDPELVGLVKAGSGWQEQFRTYHVFERRGVAEHLGIDTQDRTAMEQVQGSPFLTYAGRGDAGIGSFGFDSILENIITQLIPGVSQPIGGSDAR